MIRKFLLTLPLLLCSPAPLLPPSLALTPDQAFNQFEQQLDRDLTSPISPISPISPTPTYILPTQGILTSGYGYRWGRLHKGIDIAAPVGTPIVAAASGTVRFAGWNDGGYGNLVEILHNDGSVTLYAHNSRLLVNRGDFVSQGQAISLMGSTGYSTGPHLHFEIHPAGKGAANPLAYLEKRRPNEAWE